MRTIKDIINESKHYTDEELTQKCEHAWLQLWLEEEVDPYETSEAYIDKKIIDILEWGFDNVEELSESDIAKCKKILKTFLK